MSPLSHRVPRTRTLDRRIDLLVFYRLPINLVATFFNGQVRQTFLDMGLGIG